MIIRSFSILASDGQGEGTVADCTGTEGPIQPGTGRRNISLISRGDSEKFGLFNLGNQPLAITFPRRIKSRAAKTQNRRSFRAALRPRETVVFTFRCGQPGRRNEEDMKTDCLELCRWMYAYGIIYCRL